MNVKLIALVCAVLLVGCTSYSVPAPAGNPGKVVASAYGNVIVFDRLEGCTFYITQHLSYEHVFMRCSPSEKSAASSSLPAGKAKRPEEQ